MFNVIKTWIKCYSETHKVLPVTICCTVEVRLSFWFGLRDSVKEFYIHSGCIFGVKVFQFCHSSCFHLGILKLPHNIREDYNVSQPTQRYNCQKKAAMLIGDVKKCVLNNKSIQCKNKQKLWCHLILFKWLHVSVWTKCFFKTW